jgi:hypothetical protein
MRKPRQEHIDVLEIARLRDIAADIVADLDDYMERQMEKLKEMNK